jgi:hypothetical protein
MTNLTNIIRTVNEVTPEDKSVDMGDLAQAEQDLANAQKTLGEFEARSETYRDYLRTLVQGLGAVVIFCAVLGLLTLASRVCEHP